MARGVFNARRNFPDSDHVFRSERCRAKRVTNHAAAGIARDTEKQIMLPVGKKPGPILSHFGMCFVERHHVFDAAAGQNAAYRKIVIPDEARSIGSDWG